MVTASGNDPNGDMLTYDWDLDYDGIFEIAGQEVLYADVEVPFVSTLVVRATDPGGMREVDDAIVTVNNIAPSIEPIWVSADFIPFGTSVDTNGNFTDPGILDTHTAL